MSSFFAEALPNCQHPKTMGIGIRLSSNSGLSEIIYGGNTAMLVSFMCPFLRSPLATAWVHLFCSWFVITFQQSMLAKEHWRTWDLGMSVNAEVDGTAY